MLVTGYWMHGSGYWILDTGRWVKKDGYWMLDIKDRGSSIKRQEIIP
jgi:hypothetical protein